LRIDFLKRAIEIAHGCAGEAVSFWAGVPQPGVSYDQAWRYLEAGVVQVAEYAASRGVVVSLEPEPGMLQRFALERVDCIVFK